MLIIGRLEVHDSISLPLNVIFFTTNILDMLMNLHFITAYAMNRAYIITIKNISLSLSRFRAIKE